jgi:hypothetical protein
VDAEGDVGYSGEVGGGGVVDGLVTGLGRGECGADDEGQGDSGYEGVAVLHA